MEIGLQKKSYLEPVNLLSFSGAKQPSKNKVDIPIKAGDPVWVLGIYVPDISYGFCSPSGMQSYLRQMKL